MLNFLKTTAIAALVAAPAIYAVPASAADETLTVTTQVAAFCSVRLANVSGNNVSVANGSPQKVATLDLACNQDNATLTVDSQYGDLLDLTGPAQGNAGSQYVNYDMKVDVMGVDALDIGWVDTAPGSPAVATMAGYSSTLANGVSADFLLDLCYGAGGSTGCNASPENSEALSAPAGTYTETFTFELSGV